MSKINLYLAFTSLSTICTVIHLIKPIYISLVNHGTSNSVCIIMQFYGHNYRGIGLIDKLI